MLHYTHLLGHNFPLLYYPLAFVWCQHHLPATIGARIQGICFCLRHFLWRKGLTPMALMTRLTTFCLRLPSGEAGAGQGGLTMSLEDGFEEVDEVLRALANAPSNSSTRLFNALFCSSHCVSYSRSRAFSASNPRSMSVWGTYVSGTEHDIWKSEQFMSTL